MPSKSEAQRRLFGIALSIRRGDMSRSELKDKYDNAQEILDIVDSDMTDKDLKDFAKSNKDTEKTYKVEESRKKQNPLKYIKEWNEFL